MTLVPSLLSGIDSLIIIRKAGILEDVIIEDYEGISHLWADFAYARLGGSALFFKMGKKEAVKRYMRNSLNFLRAGERYKPWEQIREKNREPIYTHWIGNFRDSFRLGIEVYNALADFYSQHGIRVAPLEIVDGI